MKQVFEKPVCEVVKFVNDVIATSVCGCNVDGIDFLKEYGIANTTCTGANVHCGCDPNEFDPTQSNCA